MTPRIAMIGALLAGALASRPAAAQEGTMPDWANKQGSFGIGATSSLTGLNGLQIRTYVGPQFGLFASIGFHLDSVTDDDGAGETKTVQSTLEGAVGGHYKIAYWQRGSLSALFEIGLNHESSTVTVGGVDTNDSGTDVLLGLGLRGEQFVSQYFSIHADLGIRLDFINNPDPDLLTGNDGVQLDLFGDLFGSAGFTVWFK